ncbi:NAD(P)H-dependent oxidoreductase [Sulfidibacter corallicola]|uniref:NAD(P)H-dependent oxidoreductase n=1 Tax=Sulfidibacter corallicola TaxID=2818388 RepID=A0A8A4TLR6_SULCO|nr:NADPH-dependent FMN reductase [Sulfidibacter corallicola]QTD50500.1 NAD(P)H-dependent oxidoreductase [Sulfidibacter corallicola]
MSDSVSILLMSGSVRGGSYTRSLTQSIAACLEDAGQMAIHWCLHDKPLPIADPSFLKPSGSFQADIVQELVETAARCDGLVLASPIYHNSFSGVLKNALDHLSSRQLAFKACGLASHGGHRTSQAVDQLRLIARSVQSVAIPTQVCTDRDDFEIRADGIPALVAQDILQRLVRFCDEMVRFSLMLRTMREKQVREI